MNGGNCEKFVSFCVFNENGKWSCSYYWSKDFCSVMKLHGFFVLKMVERIICAFILRFIKFPVNLAPFCFAYFGCWWDIFVKYWSFFGYFEYFWLNFHFLAVFWAKLTKFLKTSRKKLIFSGIKYVCPSQNFFSRISVFMASNRVGCPLLFWKVGRGRKNWWSDVKRSWKNFQSQV